MLYGILTAFAVVLVVLDQWTKYLTVQNIPLNGFVPFWDGVFHFTHIRNTGMAFSMLEGGRWFFLVMTLAAFVVMGVALKKKWVNHPVGLVAVFMVAGGAVGNLIDRVLLGYVVDMIELDFMRFAVFNVADCAVCVGAALLVIYAFFFDEDSKKKKETSHDSDG